MNKRFFTLTLFSLFSVLALAQPNADEQKVLDLSKAKFNWMVHQQYDSLTEIVDERATYAHSNSWVQTGQEIVDDFRSGKLVYESITITNATVRLYKNCAIVMGKGNFVGAISKAPFSLDLLYTEVYVKRGKRWLLATRHASKIP